MTSTTKQVRELMAKGKISNLYLWNLRIVCTQAKMQTPVRIALKPNTQYWLLLDRNVPNTGSCLVRTTLPDPSHFFIYEFYIYYNFYIRCCLGFIFFWGFLQKIREKSCWLNYRKIDESRTQDFEMIYLLNVSIMICTIFRSSFSYSRFTGNLLCLLYRQFLVICYSWTLFFRCRRALYSLSYFPTLRQVGSQENRH